MAKQVPENSPADEKGKLLTIEELAAKHGVDAWVMAGLKVANGWGAGKELTEQEFLRAKDKWLSGPMCKGVK